MTEEARIQCQDIADSAGGNSRVREEAPGSQEVNVRMES
jgi:hypothetical protein